MPNRTAPVCISKFLAGTGSGVIVLTAICLLVSPAMAQTDTPPSPGTVPDLPACVVARSTLVASTPEAARPLIANCNGHPVMLGTADQYTVQTNKQLGAVVVDATKNGVRRVLLISPQADGTPLIEDISGQIALQVGKGPMSSIADVEVDTASFASDGSLAVQGPADTGGVMASGTIDVGQQIAAEQARAAAAPPQQ